MKITIKATVKNSLAKVWESWTTPEHITKWNFASPDWECPSAEVELKVGGLYKSRMQAKDGSFGFDFACTFTAVEEFKLLEYKMEDNRLVQVVFAETAEGVEVVETFDAENENPVEMQQQGWQSILNNFKTYTEGL